MIFSPFHFVFFVFRSEWCTRAVHTHEWTLVVASRHVRFVRTTYIDLLLKHKNNIKQLRQVVLSGAECELNGWQSFIFKSEKIIEPASDHWRIPLGRLLLLRFGIFCIVFARIAIKCQSNELSLYFMIKLKSEIKLCGCGVWTVELGRHTLTTDNKCTRNYFARWLSSLVFYIIVLRHIVTEERFFAGQLLNDSLRV